MLKSRLPNELPKTIRDVHAGRKHIDPEVAAQLAEQAAGDAPSAREVEVLRLIAAGNSNKLIADQMSLSEDTIKGHAARPMIPPGTMGLEC